MIENKNIIWEGRFQPVHRGHVAYIKTLLSYGHHVLIFVVDNEISTEVRGIELNDNNILNTIKWFSEVVDKHHAKEKNPLPFWFRLHLLQETLRSECNDLSKLTIWGGRRLDLMWNYYKKALPPNRIFFTPLRDDFEDLKAKAWDTLGEKVQRIDVSHIPIISSSMVRESWDDKDKLSELLCQKTIDILKDFKYLSI
jgi:phosphopantetheine adenylyltransferase